MDFDQDFTLPIEVWLMIFDKIDFKTFLTAKLVCKTWYGILGHDQRYAKHRILNLSGRYIHDKSEHVNAIINSTTKFNKLILEECEEQNSLLHHGFEVDLISDLNSFWEKLAQTVYEISIDFHAYDEFKFFLLHEILPKFKRLEKLKMYELESWIDSMDECKQCDHKWKHLKTLKFGFGLTNVTITPEKVQKFISMIPNVEEFHFEEGYFANTIYYLTMILREDFILSKLKTFIIVYDDNPRFVGIDYLPLLEYFSSVITLLKNSKVSNLNLFIWSKRTKLNDIYRLMHQFKSVETCELRYYIKALPVLKAKFITSLLINAYNSHSALLSLSKLNCFTKLKSLQIVGPLLAGCFFKHDCDLTIETLTLTDCGIICSKCLKTFLSSCKYLKSVIISTKTGMELKHLSELNRLTRLSIKLHDLEQKSIVNLRDLGTCSTMTELEMQVIHPLEFYSFMSAVKNLKSLKEVKLHMNDSITESYIFQVIYENLPHLTKLEIDNDISSEKLALDQKTREVTLTIDDFFFLPQTIQSVKVPEVVLIPKYQFLSKLTELFEKYRKLKLVSCNEANFTRFTYEKSLPGPYDITKDFSFDVGESNDFFETD